MIQNLAYLGCDMSDQVLIVEQQAGTVSLILHRPAVKNALNPELIQALIERLQAINNDPSVRLVIISGNGDNFSAGVDLKWMQESIAFDEQRNLQDASVIATLMRTLNTLNKTTICITHGAIYGGGVGLVACCDIVIALNSSVFCCSEVRLGLSAAVVSPYIINAIGSKAARRWLLTAETFDAVTARELGLVHEVVADQRELSAILDHFESLIMKTGPQAVAATKALLIENQEPSAPDIDAKTTRLIAQLRVSSEGQEGIKAFLEKRQPQWA
jgi:methylglutaconyl-CoA hydratase